MPQFFRSKLVEKLIDTTKTANTDWFSTDLKVHSNQNTSTRLMITIIVNTNDPKVQLTLDGTNFFYFREEEVLKKNVLYNFELYPHWQCSINLKSDINCSVIYLAISESEYN